MARGFVRPHVNPGKIETPRSMGRLISLFSFEDRVRRSPDAMLFVSYMSTVPVVGTGKERRTKIGPLDT